MQSSYPYRLQPIMQQSLGVLIGQRVPPQLSVPNQRLSKRSICVGALLFGGMQATRHMNLNSGLFYLRANQRSIALLDRIALRLSREKVRKHHDSYQSFFLVSDD